MKDKINIFIIMFVAFILGGLVMYYFTSSNLVYTNGVNNQECKACANTVIVNDGSLSAAVDKVYDAVAMIETYSGTKLSGTGSGFIYKIDNKYAYIMTNHHVISTGNKYKAILSDDIIVEGEVLGSDEYLDLAVVRIAKDKVKAVVTIGDSDSSKLGDTVFTVGAPLGYEYRGTVTAGILSGKNRLVEVSVNSNSGDWVMEVLQIDAAVNPGNSGGPLVNATGDVIGIISLKLVEASVENMGFAIPIEYAMSHISSLEKGEDIARPLLGISMLNATETWSLYMYYGITLDSTIESGVVVIDVDSKSGAGKSSLKKGDVITKINDDEITNAAYLKYILYKYNIGDTIKVTYYRDNKFNTTSIKLTKNSN